MRVYVLGGPGPCGGADTELYHTIRLWRVAGHEVHLVPTWGSIHKDYVGKMEALGVPVHRAVPETLAEVPGLAGSVVVAFCNSAFLNHYGTLRGIGCRLVWAGCMTFLFHNEAIAYAKYGLPDATVYQSNYQRATLEPQLRQWGYDRATGHLINGAFDVAEWPYRPRPHASGGDFVLGKLARKDLDKWSSNLWSIYGRVQYPHRKALVMGMTPEVAKKLGHLPDWATWLREGAMPTQEYFGSIHCLLTVNGGAAENWPRIGLEAFAAGVPVVAQRQWGWKEMIREGETGFLGDSDEELAHHAARLAWDEGLRLRITENARDSLESELADPEEFHAAWDLLFRSVTRDSVESAPTPVG